MSTNVDILRRAEAMLAQASTVAGVLEVKNLAEAARVLAIKAKLGLSAQNHAAHIKLKAERKLGELLAQMKDDGTFGPGKKSVTMTDLGLNEMETRRSQQLNAYFTEDDINERAAEATEKKSELTQAALLKEAHQKRRQEVEHTPAKADAALPDSEVDGLSLLHGDFRERLLELDGGSVDLIVTDPPYPKEDLPLYSDLAQVAAKLLSPRGILFVWTGQIFLPEVITRLSEHLNYGWTYALTLPGSGSRIMGRHIIQAWKPILAFTVGTWPSGEWGDDLLTSPAREKDTYEWQQNAAPARRLIERYSAPDGLIVDPFLGAGSFGIAAREAGRRFVGVELDAKRFAQASERIT